MTINTPAGPAPERQVISHDDYVRLVGLLTLATGYRQQLEAVERSACALVGEELGGHISDVVWGGHAISVAHLLDLLGLAVAPPPA